MKELFTAHPASVGENYFEHMGVALSFATKLMAAGLACLLHAFLPFLCVKTGSNAITELNDRMVANRRRKPLASEVAGGQTAS